MFEDTSTPVVVLVCHHHVGIGIMRSLGRLGVPVYGIEADRCSPALWSRYCRGKFLWDLHTATSDEALAYLTQVSRQLGRRALLIPTSDIGTMFVAEHAEQLADKYLFPAAPPGLVRSLCNKREMYYLAKKCHVAVPETAFPCSRQEVLDYLETARFPVLVKPMYHLVPGCKPWRMRIVTDARELLAQYDAVAEPATPNVMLQEYIPGGDERTWTFNGYFARAGDCPVAFTGRKLRNFPPYFGQASLAVCAQNATVERTTIAFMQRLGYRGPLDLGYRYDARDGQYKVNDINPRVGGMLRLFVGDNGMDVVRALYQDLTGQPVLPARGAPEGRKWLVEDVDLLSSFRYWRDGQFTLREWLRSYRGVKELAFLAADDPLPLLGAWLMDGRREWRDLLERRAPRARGAHGGAPRTDTIQRLRIPPQPR